MVSVSTVSRVSLLLILKSRTKLLLVYDAGEHIGRKSCGWVLREALLHYSKVIAQAVRTSGLDYYIFTKSSEAAIKLLVDWIYPQKLVIEYFEEDSDILNPEDTYSSLVDLWALAQKLDIRPLQNLAIRAINDVHKKSNVVPVSHIQKVYRGTFDAAELRGLLVTLCAFNHFSEIFSGKDTFPGDFVTDLSTFSAQKLRNECKYKVTDYCIEEYDSDDDDSLSLEGMKIR